jgi:5'-3' exonuclease
MSDDFSRSDLIETYDNQVVNIFSKISDRKYKIMNNKFVIFDVAYFIFKTIFRTLYEYEKKHTEHYLESLEKDGFEDWSEDDLFVSCLKARFMKLVYTIINTLKVLPANTIFVRECKKESNWRNKYYDDYKKNRNGTITHCKSRYVVKGVFKNIYGSLFEKLENICKFKIIRIHEMEADDVIFMLSKYLKKNNYKSDITIISEDKDFAQLCDDRINVQSISFKDLTENMSIDTAELMLKKVLLGDKSDNIGSCIHNNNMIETHSNHYNLLKDLIESGNLDITKYRRNKKLILLSHIPQRLLWGAHDEFEKQFNLPRILRRQKIYNNFDDDIDNEALDEEIISSNPIKRYIVKPIKRNNTSINKRFVVKDIDETNENKKTINITNIVKKFMIVSNESDDSDKSDKSDKSDLEEKEEISAES